MQNYPAPPPAYYPTERRTSGLGKASLLIAITIFLLVLVSLVAIIVMLETKSKAENVVLAASVIGWILAPGGHFLGLVLGIVDVCRKQSKKFVPGLGIALNAVLGGIGLTLLIIVLNMAIHAMGAFR